MGWNPFKSTKKIVVNTSVSRVIQDSLLPNSIKTGALKGILSTEGDQLVENILEDLTGSIGTRAERMYAYGKNTYLFGLPNSTLVDNTSNENVVWEAVSRFIGQDVTLDYYHYGDYNFQHYVWTQLFTSYGYNPQTNELKTLSQQKGKPVYLWDFQVVLATNTLGDFTTEVLQQWGAAATSGYAPDRLAAPRSHTPVRLDPTASEDHATITVKWVDGVTKEDTFVLSLASVNPDDAYFQVKYSCAANPSLNGFWSYKDGSGTYPEIDALYFTEYNGLGSFFPFGYFRFNRTDCLGQPNSTEYLHSKKLMEFIKMDYADVGNSIKENPDVADVESALMMLAVPANTGNACEARYLFDFFKEMYIKTGGTGYADANAARTAAMLAQRSSPQISMVIQDARFQMVINVSGLYRRVRSGNIGSIGTYDCAFTNEAFPYTTQTFDSENGTYVTTTSEITVSGYTYRFQRSANLYEEVHVLDPSVSYRVWESYATSFDSTSANLLIPLDHSITTRYPIPVREELYARSLHYVINSKTEVVTKWYQQSWFKAVLVIVAVVITILSYGQSWQSIGAAIASGAAASEVAILVLTLIFEAVLSGLVFSVAMKLFVKVLGVRLAFIVAVVAACYGISTGFSTGSLKGAPWAEELLQLSSGLSKAVSNEYQQELTEVSKDIIDFQTYAKEQTTLLDNANDLLAQQNVLSPFVIFGESPKDYYERTVHSGNIGTIGLDAVSSYVEAALTLPKISQTIEEAGIPS